MHTAIIIFFIVRSSLLRLPEVKESQFPAQRTRETDRRQINYLSPNLYHSERESCPN
jgi:hypothetical protein